MPRPSPFARFPFGLSALVAALLTSLSAPTLAADVFTVGAGGTHPSLQSAINACPADGCTIQLLDSLYQLPREVWIENKRNLAIERSAALRQAGIRPRLVGNAITQFQVAGTAANPTDPLRPAGWKRWPVHCKDSVGGSLDAKNPYSTNGFQYNGLLVVVASQDIRLEGIALDGQNPAVFTNKGIWNCMYDVLFGNVGINLFHSARVVVRDTEIRNFFTGFYIQNRNPGGAVASPNPNDLADQAVEPYSRYGAMGDHLIERNEIHHNWWAVYDEMEWDLGSTFRFNRIASNFNPFLGSDPSESSEMGNMAGGFLYVKDVSQAIHRIHNNTIWGSPVVIGHGYFKAGIQHLFYNNLVGGFDQILTFPKLKSALRNDRQQLSKYGFWLDHNLFEIRDSSATVTKTAFNAIQVRDSATCAAHGQSSPCFLMLDEPTSIRTVFVWPWNGWTVAGGGIIRGKVGGKLVESTHPQASELFPGGGRIQSLMPNTTQLDVLAANNHWAFELPLKSRVQGTPGFLEPDWNDSLVGRTVRGQGSLASGWTNAGGRTDRGAILSEGTTPEIWALKSQEPVFKVGVNCYAVQLRTRSGSGSGPVRLATVEAWSAPFQDGTFSAVPAVKPLKLKALLDSSFVEGQWKTICLDSTPSQTAGLRFHVTLSRATPFGTAFSEPAYYLLAKPSVDLVVGATKTPREPLALRASWVRGGLLLRGLGLESVKVTVTNLQGRRLLRTEVHPRSSAVFVPASPSWKGAVIVVVDQGGTRRSTRVVRMDQP